MSEQHRTAREEDTKEEKGESPKGKPVFSEARSSTIAHKIVHHPGLDGLSGPSCVVLIVG